MIGFIRGDPFQWTGGDNRSGAKLGSPLHVALSVPTARRGRGLGSKGLGWPDEHRRRRTRLRLICSTNDRPCVQATAQSRSRVMLLDAKRRNLWSASESGSQRQPTDEGGLRDAHARGSTPFAREPVIPSYAATFSKSLSQQTWTRQKPDGAAQKSRAVIRMYRK